MKSSHRFSNFLKWSFKILKWVVVCVGAMVLLIFFTANPDLENSDSDISLEVGKFLLQLDESSYAIHTRFEKSNDVVIEELQGSVKIKDVRAADQFYRSLKGPLIFIFVTAVALGFYTLHLLHQLFACISAGESFSDKSIRCIRNIGILTIAATLSGGFLIGYIDWIQSSWLKENLILEGIQVVGKPSQQGTIGLRINDTIRFQFDVLGLFVGFMFFAIGEAFRQGKQIQEENQLTI